MIRKSILKNQKTAPTGYIPGLARGDTGFTTGIDTAPAESQEYRRLKSMVEIQKKRIANPNLREKSDFIVDDADFDKWNGYRVSLFETKGYTEEDREADLLYEGIDHALTQRIKKKIKAETTAPAKALDQQTQQDYSIVEIRDQFKQDRTELQKLSENDWMNIPDPVPHRKNGNKREKFTPVNDSLLIPTAIGLSNAQTNVDQVGETDSTWNPDATRNVNNSMLTDVNAIDLGNSNSIQGQKKMVSGINKSIMSEFEKKGYLNQMATVDTNSFEIQDLQKARLLFKSIRESDPKNDKGWLASARLEELNGRLEEARKLLRQGLLSSSKSEDLWTELIRLSDLRDKESVINKALNSISKSVAIWMLWIDLAKSTTEKQTILQKALKSCPHEEALWTRLVAMTPEDEFKRQILEQAVANCPSSVDLWLTYAKLSDYQSARVILNNANRVFQNEEPRIWIAGASLEEANGSDESRLEKILTKGLSKIASSKNESDLMEFTLTQCVECERISSPQTGKILLQLSLSSQVFGEEDNSETDQKAILEKCGKYFEYFKVNGARTMAFETLFTAKQLAEEKKFNEVTNGINESILSYASQASEGSEFIHLMDRLLASASSSTKFSKAILDYSTEFLLKKKISFDEFANFYDAFIDQVCCNLVDELAVTEFLEDYLVFQSDQAGNEYQIFAILDKYSHLSCASVIRCEYLFRNDRSKIEEITTQLKPIVNSEKESQFIKFRATKLLADMSLHSKGISSFEAYWRTFLEKFQDNNAYIELAIGIFHHKNIYEARSIYTKVLDDKDISWMQWIKILELEKCTPITFKNLLQKALKKFPEEPWFTMLSLETDSSNRKVRVAEAIKRFPSSIEIQLCIAKVFYVQTSKEKTKLWALQAHQTDPTNMDALALLNCVDDLDFDHVEKLARECPKPRGYYWSVIRDQTYLSTPVLNQKIDFFQKLVKFTKSLLTTQINELSAR